MEKLVIIEHVKRLCAAQVDPLDAFEVATLLLDAPDNIARWTVLCNTEQLSGGLIPPDRARDLLQQLGYL